MKYRAILERYEYNKLAETRKAMLEMQDLQKEGEFIDKEGEEGEESSQYIWSYIVKPKVENK